MTKKRKPESSSEAKMARKIRNRESAQKSRSREMDLINAIAEELGVGTSAAEHKKKEVLATILAEIRRHKGEDPERDKGTAPEPLGYLDVSIDTAKAPDYPRTFFGAVPAKLPLVAAPAVIATPPKAKTLTHAGLEPLLGDISPEDFSDADYSDLSQPLADAELDVFFGTRTSVPLG